MTSYKLVAELASSNGARQLAAGMAELLDPPPAGLTLFASVAGWRIEAYCDDEPDATHLRDTITNLLPDQSVTLTIEPVPDKNWVEISQAGLPPVTAGRFTIHGTHDSNRVPQGPNSILIDAGEAFGTAHHATTYTCLLAIDEATRLRAFRNALDLGCGTGVLAIAIARALPHADILATDIDADSVRVARENATVNHTANRVSFAEMNGPPQTGYGFDLVVANILAGPLMGLAPAIARTVAPSGALILSGILSPQAAAIQARYGSMGFSIRQHRRMADWSTLTLRRR